MLNHMLSYKDLKLRAAACSTQCGRSGQRRRVCYYSHRTHSKWPHQLFSTSIITVQHVVMIIVYDSSLPSHKLLLPSPLKTHTHT